MAGQAGNVGKQIEKQFRKLKKIRHTGPMPHFVYLHSLPAHRCTACIYTVMNCDMYDLVAPEWETGVLQPNDVHVFGLLNALADGVWRKQMREEPEVCDSWQLPSSIIETDGTRWHAGQCAMLERRRTRCEVNYGARQAE